MSIVFRKKYVCVYIHILYECVKAVTSLVVQVVKNLPMMQEAWVWFLGQEDPLEKEMATYSSILAWEILWIEEPGGLQSMGSLRVRYDWMTNTIYTCQGCNFTVLQYILYDWILNHILLYVLKGVLLKT